VISLKPTVKQLALSALVTFSCLSSKAEDQIDDKPQDLNQLTNSSLVINSEFEKFKIEIESSNLKESLEKFEIYSKKYFKKENTQSLASINKETDEIKSLLCIKAAIYSQEELNIDIGFTKENSKNYSNYSYLNSKLIKNGLLLHFTYNNNSKNYTYSLVSIEHQGSYKAKASSIAGVKLPSQEFQFYSYDNSSANIDSSLNPFLKAVSATVVYGENETDSIILINRSNFTLNCLMYDLSEKESYQLLLGFLNNESAHLLLLKRFGDQKEDPKENPKELKYKLNNDRGVLDINFINIHEAFSDLYTLENSDKKFFEIALDQAVNCTTPDRYLLSHVLYVRSIQKSLIEIGKSSLSQSLDTICFNVDEDVDADKFENDYNEILEILKSPFFRKRVKNNLRGSLNKISKADNSPFRD